MEDLLPRLENLLAKQIEAHDNVLETGKKMNAALKQKQLEEIQRLNMNYDAYVGRIEEFEEQRLAVCDEIAKTMDKRHVNIATIIEVLNEDQRGTLTRYRSLLKEKIGQISRINTSNFILLEASLAAISKNVEVIARSQEKYQGYGQGGVKASRKVSRSIINKIA